MVAGVSMRSRHQRKGVIRLPRGCPALPVCTHFKSGDLYKMTTKSTADVPLWVWVNAFMVLPVVKALVEYL